MPRRARVQADGISCNAANREPCFFGEEDYSTYLHWLGEALKDSGCALHAYELMTKHIHLLFIPKRAERVPKHALH